MSAPALELWDEWRSAGDPGVRARLLDAYLGLVYHAARTLWRSGARGMELAELIGAGTLGLIQAFEGFHPARGLAFSTFAMPRIRGAMLDEMRRLSWAPRTVMERRRALLAGRATLEQRLGRAPGPGEVADHLELDLATYWKWAGDVEVRKLVSLDESGGDGFEDLALHERIADPRIGDATDSLANEQALRWLREALLALPERDRLVLSLLYVERLTLRDIGATLGVSESRVSQIHARALRRLRERMSGEDR